MAKPESSRLYERVASDLAAKIAAGTYPVGQRLPSERELAQSYSVSRPTVREAIFALELDGQVEVRTGSGVYVVARAPRSGHAGVTDIGPFELLEARRAIEGEAAFLAASRISDTELAEIERHLTNIVRSPHDIAASEEADPQLLLAIARATGNNAMHATVEMLWMARARSPQYRLLSGKAHDPGVGPPTDEHTQTAEALRARDSDPAPQP